METLRKETELNSNHVLKIIVQRHGVYYKQNSTTSDDMNRLGWLTPEGIATTSVKATEAVARYLECPESPNFEFLFLNSPARYLGIYGARAQQTASVAAGEVKKVFGESKIIHLDKTSSLTRNYPIINESHLEHSEEHRLDKKYGGNFWELYYNMSDQLEELTDRSVLSESAIEISNRAVKAFKTIFRFWKNYQSQNPDKKLITWCATHGDVIRSFIQHGMGVGQNAQNWRANYSETFEFNITDNGVCSFNFQGKQYSRSII